MSRKPLYQKIKLNMQLDEIWQTPFASYMREVALNPVSSWNEFEDRISRLGELHAELGTATSTLLFRGQPHECWHVESTLERKIAGLPKCQEDLDYQHYLATINSIKHRVEDHAGIKFDLKTSPQPQSYQPDFGSHYEYLVYLRHHNFPSPIVDWSRSHHVAAHFAFENHEPSPNVKVFIFFERPGGVKGGWAADARIIHLNREGELHHRHIAQKAEHTICLHPMGDGRFVIKPHTPILESTAPMKHQDLLTGILIPRTLRADFIHRLNELKLDTHNAWDEHDDFIKSLEKVCFDDR